LRRPGVAHAAGSFCGDLAGSGADAGERAGIESSVPLEKEKIKLRPPKALKKEKRSQFSIIREISEICGQNSRFLPVPLRKSTGNVKYPLAYCPKGCFYIPVMQKTTSASPETLARRTVGLHQTHSPTCSRTSGAPRCGGDLKSPFGSPFLLCRKLCRPAFLISKFSRASTHRRNPHNSGSFHPHSTFKTNSQTLKLITP
jgi:hypothetical protein